MRRMGIGLGVGINRSNYAQGIFGAYATRVVADGGVVEAGACVDAVSGLLLNASLLLIPSGYKGGKLYAEIPTNGNGDLTWTRGSDAFRTNASGLIQRVPWNLFTYSEELDSVTWFKTTGVSITANATSAPNDTLTADRVTGATGTGTWADPNTLGKNVGGLVTSSLYTASIYLRSTSTSSQVTFQFRDQTTGSVNSIVCNLTSSWQRFNLSRTTGASSTGLAIILSNATADFFAWGAQLVEGTTAQTYLPTTDRLNVPRLTYQNGGGGCPSLLLEPQRTNLVSYSEEFDNAYWTKNVGATITANSTTAPDGTTTADTLNVIASTFSGIYRAISGASANYTISIYAKKNTKNWLYLFDVNGSAVRAWFNLDSGVVGTVASGYTSTITNVGNGWYRCTLTNNTAMSASYYQFGLSDADNSSTPTSSGSAFIWGAQVEAGSYPTSYIPTTSSSATRVADAFTRNNIYTNGLITSSGGTWFVELRGNVAYTRDASISGFFIDTSNGGSTNGFSLRNGGGTARLTLIKVIGGVSTTLFLTTTDTTKIAVKWNGTSADVFVNGTKQVSATSFTTTNMEFLSSGGGDVPKFIQQMALYPSPLSDTDCTTLTTL